MQPIAGMCPLCHAEGRTGKPCRQPVCERHGYHFVPIEYFDSHRARPSHRRDSVIGLCADDYLIVDELGEGGFGKVYLALLLPVYMKVALKLLVRAERSPRSELMLLETFEREAMSLAQLNHPNIVRLLKYGAWKGKPYLVTEFVDNARTLKAEFESQVLRNEAFEPAAVRHILDQLLNALNNAHAKQIVHRDIKPDNIMLQEIDGDPYFVRVLDFGLAKFAVGGDHISTVVGTPRYMTPEHFLFTGLGQASDVYSLALILWEMLTGRVAFPVSGQGSMRQQAMQGLGQKLFP